MCRVVQSAERAHPARVGGDVSARRGRGAGAPLGRALPARAAPSAASAGVPHAPRQGTTIPLYTAT